MPDLPKADHPNIKRYNEFLLSNYESVGDWTMSWEFDENSIIIGHSSGAVEMTPGLLSDTKFPKDVKVKACFLIGVFKGDLGWASLKGMTGDFNFELIKKRCPKFIFIHSDNDPYCPIDDARELCKQVNGKFIELTGQEHFTVSLDPKYTEFPELLEAIKTEVK